MQLLFKTLEHLNKTIIPKLHVTNIGIKRFFLRRHSKYGNLATVGECRKLRFLIDVHVDSLRKTPVLMAKIELKVSTN